MPDSAPLSAGQLVDDKYVLVEPCGSGGMGAVWRAKHVTLGTAVAIKFLHGSISGSPEARARFEREAKLSAQLGNESLHVARVMDHGLLDDGRPFIVMELLKGESLAERLDREGMLPFALMVNIVTQLCRALHVAHVAGVIHRDLKPANVFLCRGEEQGTVHVKLLDFGVAKATLELDAIAVTRVGYVVGTPNYMSPEQVMGEKFLDARSDLWAVAAIAYRMVVGAPPFGSGALSELGQRITSIDPMAPSTLVDTPVELDAWMRKGLAKKRDQRFQTTGDLVEALAQVAAVSAKSPARAMPERPRPAAHDAPAPSLAISAGVLPIAKDELEATRAGDVTRVEAQPTARRLPVKVPEETRAAPIEQAAPQPRVRHEEAQRLSWEPPRSYAMPLVITIAIAAVGSLGVYLVLGGVHDAPRAASSGGEVVVPIHAVDSTEASASASASASGAASSSAPAASATASQPAGWSSAPQPRTTVHVVPLPTIPAATSATTTSAPTATAAPSASPSPARSGTIADPAPAPTPSTAPIEGDF